MLKLVDLTEETAPKIRDLMYKVFGYSHSGKHLYQPAELLARYQRGDFVPMMVADREDDRLLGYFDMGFPFGGRDVAWFGCLALDPDLNEMTRMAVLNTLLKDCIDKVGKSFRYDGLRLVITTDTVDHTLSQRLSGQFGLINVGLLFATVPTGGHQFRGGYRPQGAAVEIRQGRRPEVLSVYPAYKFLDPYDCYLAPDHAELTLPLYEALDLPVTFREVPAEPADKMTVMREYPDLGRGIVTLEIERIGEDIETVLKERVDHFRTGYIPAIHVLVPQYPQDPAVAHQVLAGLGGLFGGLFPRFKGRDMILMQLVDPDERLVDESRLKDEAARKVAHMGREG
ncbi:hypothetical protein [Aestuariispira insulae]|uniref:N-acetyltransferase domain-containing protein n=1 Tax=Aestuariispira insulae TaxID=1461337 RepID=A0A3D9H3X5_9PROT|nr:hypothetical protein [Aestuariispira insulae]RED44188.1 hypothetical protein DFP90_11629 [Aestuariispira insulae]